MTAFHQASPLPQIDQCFDLLNDAIEQSQCSAAQFVVSDEDGIRADIALGMTLALKNKNPFQTPCPIDHATLFDIASLTKPLATAGLIMQAVDAGMIELGVKLVNFDSGGIPTWLLGSTIADLLTHRTLLPAWIDLSASKPGMSRLHAGRMPFESVIYHSEPRSDGATYCYSDLGYIILGFLLEDIYGESLVKLFADNIAAPLDLQEEMMFCPLHRIDKKTIVATCAIGRQFAQGHPDDSNARVLSHYAGHAGLFASARAIDAYVRALFNGTFPCSGELVREFVSYRSSDTPFALGWDRPSGDDSLSGAKVGDPVVGHLGFTGCSVWFNLETKRCITLLTNRTHLSDSAVGINDLRRKLYRLCWSDVQ